MYEGVNERKDQDKHDTKKHQPGWKIFNLMSMRVCTLGLYAKKKQSVRII